MMTDIDQLMALYRMRIGAHQYEVDDETGERIYRTEAERRERLEDLGTARCEHCDKLIIAANQHAVEAHASEADSGYLFGVLFDAWDEAWEERKAQGAESVSRNDEAQVHQSASRNDKPRVHKPARRNARKRGLRADRQYCSDACRQAAYRQRRKDES